MTDLLGGDVHQQVLAPGIAFAKSLGEVAHRGGQLALWAAELFKHEAGELRVGFADAHGIHQFLVMKEHEGFSGGRCGLA